MKNPKYGWFLDRPEWEFTNGRWYELGNFSDYDDDDGNLNQHEKNIIGEIVNYKPKST